MPRRLVSVDDSFNLPASVKAVDANLPARLQDAALSATIGQSIKTQVPSEIGARQGKGASFFNPGSMPADPTTCALSKIAGWGSSTMEALGALFSEMAAGFGADFYNKGKGGEESQHTLARLGSRPALLTIADGTIPASGAVTVTCSNMEASASMLPFAGYLGGVLGTLSSTSTTLTFTRSAAGTAATILPDEPFFPKHDLRNAFTILNIGKGDMSATDDPADAWVGAAAGTHEAFDFLLPETKRVIVMGHFANRDWGADDQRRSQILAYNAAMKVRYGWLYFDQYNYLTSSQVWVDTGITPTSADLAAQAIGNKPPSLSSDDAHLNTAGNTAVVNRLKQLILGRRLHDLEPATPDTVTGLLWDRDADTLAAIGTQLTAWPSAGGSLGAEGDLSVASTTVSRRPYVVAGPGAHKAVGYVRGNGTYLRSNNLTAPLKAPLTVAYLVKSTAPPSNALSFLLSGSLVDSTMHHLGIGMSQTGTIYATTANSLSELAGVTATGSWAVVFVVFNGDSSVIEVNGTARAGTTGVQGDAAELVRIVEGTRGDLSTTYAHTADVVRCVAWNRALEIGDRRQWETTIRAHYGV